MLNVPLAIVLVVVPPLAILCTLVFMVINALRRRPVHAAASIAIMLVCTGATVYGATCLVMHVATVVEEKAPRLPEMAKDAATAAADTTGVIVKEGIRAGSTAVVQGATEAADEIKGKWTEADLATARELRVKFVRQLSSGAAADGQLQDVTVIVSVENTTPRKVDFAHLVDAGLVVGIDETGSAYPATGLVNKQGELPPRMRTVRVLRFEVEPKVKLVDVRIAGGSEGPTKAP